MKRFLIFCLNLCWNWLSFSKRALYHSGLLSVTRLSEPCISIGNLAAGGTGKSPLVEIVIHILVERGHFPAILTRGYRSGVGKSSIAVFQAGKISHKKNLPHEIYPDEAVMLSTKLGHVPVVVSPNRIAAAIWYQSQAIQPITHWVLDDGFQHVQMYRDVDIVLIDSHSMREKGALYRESWEALRYADLVIWTRCEEGAPSEEEAIRLNTYTTQPSIQSVFHMQSPCLLGDAAQQLCPTEKILVFCGIANPSYFISGLEKMGFFSKEIYIVSDHQRVSFEDIRSRIHDAKALVTTEKDYYRDPAIFENFPIPVYLVPLEVELDREKLVAVLISRMSV